MGQHFGTMISSISQLTTITILAFIYLDDSAASLIMVTLLPLATVPVIIRSSVSIKTADETEISNEEANHVCV